MRLVFDHDRYTYIPKWGILPGAMYVYIDRLYKGKGGKGDIHLEPDLQGVCIMIFK